MNHKTNAQPALGLWMLTALVAGNMIGSGVFLLPSALAEYGAIGLFAWFATSIGAMLLALVFAQLSRMLPRVGGPYAYCREAYGDFLGFQIAYNYWVALWVGNAAIVVALVGYLAYFYPVLASKHFLGLLAGLAILWFMTLLNVLSIRQAGMTQLVTMILKLLPLLAVSIFGIAHTANHGSHLMHEFNLSGKPTLSAFIAAAAITLWSFIGVESATVPAESVKNPARNIARATILGTLITAGIYILSAFAIMSLIPGRQLAGSTAPYADAAVQLFGPLGGSLIALGAIISCLGALNGWTLLQGQVPMAIARDHLFPRVFAKQNQQGSPFVGLIVSSILITLLLSMRLKENLVNKFTFIILLATLASLIPYFFTAVSQVIIMKRNREKFNKAQFRRAIIIAILASIYAFWAIVGAGEEIIYYGFLLFLTSVPVYAWLKWRYPKEIASAAEVEAERS